jgi:hypothetical protein
MSAASHQKQSYSRATQVVKVQFHRFIHLGELDSFEPCLFIARLQHSIKYLFLKARPVVVVRIAMKASI